MGRKRVEFNIDVFNYDTKILFLESIKNNSSKDAYKSMLIQISKYEKEINKNLYDMNINETKNCIDTLTRTTLNASSTLLSKLSTYFFWAIANNFTDNVETLSWIKILKGEDIVSKTAMASQYITKEDLYGIAEIIRNAQNKALIILLFHGVEGTELSELRQIKKSDIDFNNNIIYLTGYTVNHNKKKTYHRNIELASYDMDILKEAMEQTSYYEINPRRIRGQEAKQLSPLIESEYLFKNIEYIKEKANNSNVDVIRRSELIKRIREISQQINKPLTPGNIIMSGQIYELTQLNKEFEDITEDDYNNILKKYNKKINKSSMITLRDLFKYLLKNEIKVAVQ